MRDHWSFTFFLYNMDPVFYAALFITCLAVLCAKWVADSWRKGAGATPLPPGPRGFPIFGYVPFLGKDLHLTFTNLASIYGPIYKVWLCNQMCLVLSSPAVVKEVVRDKDTIFANRDSPIATLIGTYNGSDVAFAKYDHEWSRLRKIFVQEMLSNEGLDACYDIRREEVRKAIREIYKKVGTQVAVGKTLLQTTISAVLGMVWGESIFENNREGIDFKELLTEFTEVFHANNVSDFFPAVAWLDLQGIEKRIRKLFSQVDQFYEQAIEKRRQSVNLTRSGRKDLLQHLLELKYYKDASSPSSSFTMTQLKAVLQDIALGGTDSTATTVEWAVCELLAHPQILERVYEELNDVVGLNKFVEEYHVPKLQYMNAVLKETLRLHPAAPFLIPRKPCETTTVGGYTVPKGSKVLINIWAIHRDPNLWESPLEFMPERFLDDSFKLDFSGNNFKYMPLGSGRRKCPGLPLADRFVLYLFASFMHSFTWHVPDGVGNDFFKAEFGLVCKKAVPLVAIPTPRHTNLELYA